MKPIYGFLSFVIHVVSRHLPMTCWRRHAASVAGTRKKDDGEAPSLDPCLSSRDKNMQTD